MKPQDLLFRAATPADLPAFEHIAAASAVGINTLPPDRAQLQDKLERSARAFAAAGDSIGDEIYLFVLEDTRNGHVVGSSGIAASAGFHDRFYSYRHETVVHASQALGKSTRIPTLHLCHDLTGYTLLTSFYIEPAYAHGPAPQLLSRARLLFLAEFADRFSDRIAAESLGLSDDSGRCPFWDAVGRRFFDMDYPAAELLTGGRSKAFIAELMPRAPIYVPLLPPEAQWALGQLHPAGELPFSILQDEGFDSETYVDIFDGGPTVHARTDMLKSVAQSRRLETDAGSGAAGGWHIVANTERGRFRATLGAAAPGRSRVALGPATLGQIGVHAGEPVRVAALRWPMPPPLPGGEANAP